MSDELTIEEWRDIPGFEGRYQASSHGRVRGLRAPNGRPRKNPKILLPTYDDRCTRIVLTVKYKSFPRLLHRVILETFVGPCPEGMEGSHKDGNCRNNRIDNLCWETHAENEQRKNEHGTRPFGTGMKISKLTEDSVFLYRKRHQAGENSYQLAREAGVSQSTMFVALKGDTWKHVPMN